MNRIASVLTAGVTTVLAGAVAAVAVVGAATGNDDRDDAFVTEAPIVIPAAGNVAAAQPDNVSFDNNAFDGRGGLRSDFDDDDHFDDKGGLRPDNQRGGRWDDDDDDDHHHRDRDRHGHDDREHDDDDRDDD